MKHNWCSSYGLLFLGDCSIELIEETQDDQREAYWIQKLYCVNSHRMKYGVGEMFDKHAMYLAWRAANIEKVRAKERLYSQTHREEKAAAMKVWRAANIESLKVKKKAHHAANRERDNARVRQWHAANRDSQLQKARVRVICDRCGTETSRHCIARHKRTDKCKRLSKEKSTC